MTSTEGSVGTDMSVSDRYIHYAGPPPSISDFLLYIWVIGKDLKVDIFVDDYDDGGAAVVVVGSGGGGGGRRWNVVAFGGGDAIRQITSCNHGNIIDY